MEDQSGSNPDHIKKLGGLITAVGVANKMIRGDDVSRRMGAHVSGESRDVKECDVFLVGTI